MKKIILSVILLLLSTTSLAAMTVVETTAKHDILYNHPVSMGTSMGKLAATDEYGVFLNIVCRAEEGESEQVSFFYRLNSGAVVEGKSLFTEIEGEKILLGNKKWYGWKLAENVEIKYQGHGKPYPVYRVWLEVD